MLNTEMLYYVSLTNSCNMLSCSMLSCYSYSVILLSGSSICATAQSDAHSDGMNSYSETAIVSTP
jgi:hypothetical protein